MTIALDEDCQRRLKSFKAVYKFFKLNVLGQTRSMELLLAHSFRFTLKKGGFNVACISKFVAWFL